MEVVEKKEMVHKDVYESGEKEYASKRCSWYWIRLNILGPYNSNIICKTPLIAGNSRNGQSAAKLR